MKAEAKLPHVVTPKGLTSLRTPEFLTQDNRSRLFRDKTQDSVH